MSQETPTVVLVHGAFAADLPAAQAALLAATLRPVAEAAFGPPAWKRLPSWTVLATGAALASVQTPVEVG